MAEAAALERTCKVVLRTVLLLCLRGGESGRSLLEAGPVQELERDGSARVLWLLGQRLADRRAKALLELAAPRLQIS